MSSIYSVLPKEDWDLLLKGAKTIKLAKGDVVIKEGDTVRRIYQCSSGTCGVWVFNLKM